MLVGSVDQRPLHGTVVDFPRCVHRHQGPHHHIVHLEQGAAQPAVHAVLRAPPLVHGGTSSRTNPPQHRKRIAGRVGGGVAGIRPGAHRSVALGQVVERQAYHDGHPAASGLRTPGPAPHTTASPRRLPPNRMPSPPRAPPRRLGSPSAPEPAGQNPWSPAHRREFPLRPWSLRETQLPCNPCGRSHRSNAPPAHPRQLPTSPPTVPHRLPLIPQQGRRQSEAIQHSPQPMGGVFLACDVDVGRGRR